MSVRTAQGLSMLVLPKLMELRIVLMNYSE